MDRRHPANSTPAIPKHHLFGAHTSLQMQCLVRVCSALCLRVPLTGLWPVVRWLDRNLSLSGQLGPFLRGSKLLVQLECLDRSRRKTRRNLSPRRIPSQNTPKMSPVDKGHAKKPVGSFRLHLSADHHTTRELSQTLRHTIDRHAMCSSAIRGQIMPWKRYSRRTTWTPTGPLEPLLAEHIQRTRARAKAAGDLLCLPTRLLATLGRQLPPA